MTLENLNRKGNKRGMTTVSRSVTKYPPGKHPNSLANLIPYKPGENGHQFGGFNLAERLKHSLLKPHKQLDKDATMADQFVYSTIEGAIKREPTPFKEVWDRVDGKVPDKTIPSAQVNVVFVIGKGYQE